VEYKGRIQEAISEKGLNGHVKVQAAGNTLTLAEKIRPAEHGALLKLLRNAPSDVALSIISSTTTHRCCPPAALTREVTPFPQRGTSDSCRY